MSILLVDDHVLFRRGLMLLLQAQAQFQALPCLEASSCDEALAVLAATPDIRIVLLDLALPGTSGLDGLVLMREHHPTVPVALLTGQEHPRFAAEAIRRGARGFIPKSSPAEILAAAIQLILAGGTYVPALPSSVPALGATASRGLTARELEVLGLILQDLSNKEIAAALSLRVNTVRVHVASILRQLGVDDRQEAARVALSLGLGQIHG